MLRKTLALLATLGLLLLIYAFFIEPARLVIRQEKLALGKPSWRGLKIALLADLHVGAPFQGLDKLELIVEETNAQKPELIVLLGDYVIQEVVGGKYISPQEFAPVLGRLRAPLGVYAVIGNHDGWLDAGLVRRALEDAGIVVLENEARRLKRPEGSFWITGLGDYHLEAFDVAQALSAVDDDAPVLALTHGPDLFPLLPERISLTLAGHTHGGQVKFPFLDPPIVPSRYGARYARGHVEENGRHLWVSSGIGTSILPVRLGVPPEIVILELQ